MSGPTAPNPSPNPSPNPAPEKSWQARIGEATDKLAASFVESISYDRRLYKHDVAGSIAHATMLAKVGLITDAERNAIINGLKSIERDIESDNFAFDETLEDIHMVVEAELIKRIGEPGRKLHTGRSRNDQVAADLALWLFEANDNLRRQVEDLIAAYQSLAAQSADIVMPSYTHMQRAQPISAGAEAAAWATMFARDRVRLLSSQLSVYEFRPLGSGAIAGSSLPIDPRETSLHFMAMNDSLRGTRSATAEELLENYKRQTFSPLLPLNSIEHTATRDHACDLLYACAMIAQHLSRWAEQWIIYMSTEFSFLKIADRYTTSSSMMPQKRNPDMLELIRGRCGNVYGDLFALMTILKGLPIGYNRDLQEDKRIVFRAYDTVSSCLTMAAAIVNSASFIRENIEPTLDRGFLDATSLAEYLVTKGIPFRTAHHVVGSLVVKCEREGKHALSQLRVEDFQQALQAAGVQAAGLQSGGVGPDVYDALGAKNVVKRYRSAGAAGGEPFRQQLAEWKKRLGMG